MIAFSTYPLLPTHTPSRTGKPRCGIFCSHIQTCVQIGIRMHGCNDTDRLLRLPRIYYRQTSRTPVHASILRKERESEWGRREGEREGGREGGREEGGREAGRQGGREEGGREGGRKGGKEEGRGE